MPQAVAPAVKLLKISHARPLRGLPAPGGPHPQVRARGLGRLLLQGGGGQRAASSSSTTRDLDSVHPPPRDSIGARSAPYGPARVEVLDEAGSRVVATGETDHRQPLLGDRPRGRHRLPLPRAGERPGVGGGPAARLGPGGRGAGPGGERARLRQPVPHAPAAARRRRPSPSPPSETSAPACAIRPRWSAASGRWRRHWRRRSSRDGARLILTTGDNIYAGRTLLGIPVGATGDEDDDWFFTFYQPYRYLLNRIPVHPSVGNHDGNETEVNDDRDQLMDNFFLHERLVGEEAAGRASIGPGPLLPLPLRPRRGVRLRGHLAAVAAVRRSLLPPPEPRAVPGGRLSRGRPARTRRAGASRSRTIRRTAPGPCTATRSPAWRRWCRSTAARACAWC